MAGEFKAGMMVRLKPGGSLMTIAEIRKGPDGILDASCIWFEGVKKIVGNFPVVTLIEDDDTQHIG